MNLGPNKLKITLRNCLKSKKFKKEIKKFLHGRITWESKILQPLKNEIRLRLRTEQNNRCIYCRRIIKPERRNTNEDIEHFLDKSKIHYHKWAFSTVNLTLACRACNFTKSTKDLGNQAIKNDVNIKRYIGQFRWLHPYFDNYHDNIEILKGWVYKIRDNAPNRQAAENLINECKLCEISKIEEASEKRKDRQARLISLSLKSIELKNKERTRMLLTAIQEEIRKTWFDW